MSQKLEFHPVADLFPLLQGDAFQKLVADIRQNGLLEPILVDAQRRIIDGRNRYLACLEAGVEPRSTEWQGERVVPELSLSLNLHRRHLNESQRALVAARLAKLWTAQGLSSAANLQPRSAGRVCDKAARQVNVSPRLVAYAAKVLDRGCSELIAAVESGGLKVSIAAVFAGLPRERQIEEVARGPQRATPKARVRRKRKNEANSPPRCPGSFGVFPNQAPQGQQGPPGHGIVLLWVGAGGLSDAIQALQVRGFRFAG